MGSFLYNVIVKPLELIIELVFAVPYWYTQNPILSIVAVSVFVNILTLPLYKRSDALQSREREKQKAMKPWVTHIRKTFRGDEQLRRAILTDPRPYRHAEHPYAGRVH